MALSNSDFRRIVNVVADHPLFRVERDRFGLVDRMFTGSERGDALLRLFDLGGGAATAATNIVKKVDAFGQLEYGRSALAVLLATIQNEVNDDDANFIAELFTRYDLSDKPLRPNPVSDWRDPSEDPTEKIIGEDTLLPISVLESGLTASLAVVRIRVKPIGSDGWVGTGFLVGSAWIMTCHHVIPNRGTLARVTCEFNYQLDFVGRECPVTEAKPIADGRFQTDQALDFSVFELSSPIAPCLAVPIHIANYRAREAQRVAIIQHPGGRPKHISLYQNRVTYADKTILQYVTSTEPGSSGAPILDNRTFEVLGVHNKGGNLSVPGKHGKYLRNEGSQILAILDKLKALDPKIVDEIHGQGQT